MLKKLQRIVQEMSTATSLLDALSVAVTRLSETIQVDAASIFLIDEAHGEYVLAATVGLNADSVGKIHLKLGEGLVGFVGEREEPINLDTVKSHSHYRSLANLGDQSLLSFLGVPIFHQGGLLGVFVAQRRESRFFSEEEEAFLVTLSVQLGGEIAISRAQGTETVISRKRRRKKSITVLNGISGASGVAIGKAVVLYSPADLDAVPDRPADNVEEEIELFESALLAARDELQELQSRAKLTLSVAETALFDVYSRILDSRTLMNEVENEIKGGLWAQGALKRVIKRHIVQFESLDDPYLQERAADFRDLGRRVLSHLQKNKLNPPEFAKNTILVSDEVSAASLVEVPEGCLVGVISGSGSGHSHVAILARALGVPTVMSVKGAPINQLAGKELIVDGYNGQVYISPTAVVKKEFKQLISEEQQLDEELEALRDLAAETKDGHIISLYVNTGLAVDGGVSLSAGAEGVGLYRTELPFMLRDRFPSEEEQRIMYRQLLNTFSPRPVTMRTLDIGGDKVLPYFPVVEENPFLGWRGVRISLDHPDIFLQQLRAMMQASEGLDNLSLMLPMISSIRELEACLVLIQQAFSEVKDEGRKIVKPKVGLMIEVPSAVYQSHALAKRVDFLSVGSNDLIQYLLAVDRNNPRVAGLYNGLHPAVLYALDAVVKAGHKAHRPVTICGELASDPLAVVLLLGMGFDALSVNARSLARVKWVIRQFNYDEARSMVKEVLTFDDANEVSCHMETILDEAGLGGLIRAGR